MKKLSFNNLTNIGLNPKFIISILVTLILGFFGGLGYSQYSTNKQNQLPTQATVLKVTDGDTLELDSGKTIRFYGVNCPEKNQPYYQEAKTFTQNKAANQKITIEYEPKYEQDKFGRLLGYVFIDGENLNISLVRQGLCKTVIYEKRAKIKYQDQLLEAENQAKQEKLNLWSK